MLEITEKEVTGLERKVSCAPPQEDAAVLGKYAMWNPAAAKAADGREEAAHEGCSLCSHCGIEDDALPRA